MIAAASAALALGSGLAVLPATAASAAYSCDMHRGAHGWYAGHYSGMTTQPSTTGVSNAGIEAQCLLRKYNYNPGTIDGVFGPTSRRAAREFQEDMNEAFGAGLVVDGKIGPRSWVHLRSQP
jgi:hypothetical protein